MNKHAGFTLIESLIVIVVLGIALAIAVPNLRTLTQNNLLSSQLNQLGSTLALARSEAIKQNDLVVVCVAPGSLNCDSTSTNWHDGWIVFVDRDGDFVVDDGTKCATGATADCLVTAQDPFVGGNLTLAPAADVQQLIAFNGAGEARCDSNNNGTLETCDTDDTYFVICDNRGAGHARALAISHTGRVSVSDKQPNGSTLSCTP